MDNKIIDPKARAVIRILVTLRKPWETMEKSPNQIRVIKPFNQTEALNSNGNAAVPKQRCPYSRPNRILKPIELPQVRRVIVTKSPRELGISYK